MKRSLLFVCLTAFIILALSRCKPPEKAATNTSTPPAPQSMSVPSEVAGPVMFRPTEHDVLYVPDFTVTLKGGGEPQTAKTDLAGRYVFSDLKPGKYTVCWDATGFQSGCTPEVEVKEGQSPSPQPAELKPATPDSVVWGTVRLADGSAAAAIDRSSATIEVPAIEVAGAGGNAVAQFRTNAAGQYVIGLSAPAASVRAIAGSARQELRMVATAAGKPRDITLPNHRPVISSIEITGADAAAKTVKPGDTLKLRAHTTDADDDTLQYKWDAAAGTITPGDGGTATWKLPDFEAQLSAYVFVMDGKGGADRKTTAVKVGLSSLPIKLGGPPTCSPLSLASVPPPSGYPPPPFLTFMGTTDYSATYYRNVDPQNRRATLEAWWRVAGFNPADGSGGVAKAPYLNFNDLGFGRDMHFNQVGNNVYAWVTNYGCPDNNPNNANLAARPVPANAVATVCMEYAPIEGQSQQIVKFFVYVGGLPAGTLQGKADLDQWGAKPVPNLCQVCHGSNSQYRGSTNVNLGSSFIPFDLALLRYPGPSPTPPVADLPAYYRMNQLVKATNPTPAIVNLINGWYTPLVSPPTQNNNYIPAGWKAGGSVPTSAAGLYQNVIVPGCRTCHYSFSPGSGIQWDTYPEVLNDRSFIQSYVCAKGPVMPHAAVTYINFWTNPYPFPQPPPKYLGAYTDTNWPSYGGCTGK